LPLPALRLMVPPLRLVSAAIWQTIQQSHVMDYGMLEEFVTMVTDVVPELLNDSQRAQLILGLRARVRGRDGTRCPDLRQHLYSVFKADAEVGLSESSFLGLVQTLLKDPDEREHFFQDVFPVEFGSSYDAAIQKLMWQFLSRLEKLLPVDSPSLLEECVESVSHPQQLKTLLQYHRDLGQLDNHGKQFHRTRIDVCFSSVGTKTFSLFKVSFIYPLPFLDTLSSSDGDCILSALCLPPVERVVIATEQTDSETHVSSLNVFIDTFTKELEVDSATLAKYTEMEPGTNMDVIAEDRVECKRKEKASSVINEEDNSEFAETEEVEPVLVLGEDGKMAPLIKTNKLKGLKRDRNDTGGMPDGKKHRTPSPPQMKSIDLSDTIISSMLHKPSVELQRIDTANLTLPLEPVRRNRGRKMKTLLARELKQTKTEFSEQKKRVCKRVKTPQNPNMCTVCGRVLSRFSDMKKHMQTHKNGRTYQCRNCQKTFKHLYTLQTHRKSCLFGTGQQEEIPSIKRPKCSSTAKKSNRKTFQKPKHMCCICGKYVTAGAFEYHMRTHSGERPFSCPHPQCGMKFIHRCRKVLPVQCSMCEESFMLTNLRTHYLDVHKFSGPFVCTHCPKSYKKFHSLIKHEMVHTGNLPLQCSQCPKRFIYNYDLVEHEKRHSDDRPCLCWELSNSRANHEKTKHGGVRYPCTYCGKQFVCANALKRHDLIHTGERPFKCNHKSCDKAFRSRAELRIHTRYHTGERPFKCNVCGKGFVQANYLTTHYRTHTGEKPYSCSVCDKSFNYHDSLKRHMSTHSNEKPYKCLDCGKAFERKTLLNVHKRSCTSLLKC
uniref:C2H2-type domain-containing protein n=1 Tax=Oncorhynchus mykiss TaxID=8022 RepID=A0A8C7VPA9_ONCMY